MHHPIMKITYESLSTKKSILAGFDIEKLMIKNILGGLYNSSQIQNKPHKNTSYKCECWINDSICV